MVHAVEPWRDDDAPPESGVRVRLPAPFTTPYFGPKDKISAIPLVGPVIGILYGIFVEVDDGERKKAAEASSAAPPKT